MSRALNRFGAGCGCALALAIAVVGCSSGEDSVGDVADRFGAMTRVAGDPHGVTSVSLDEPATVWALVRRDALNESNPADCTLDGDAMDEPPEDINVPEPDDLGAPGQSQTMFAFAAAEDVDPGEHAVTCSLNAEALLFLLEPAG